MKDRTSNAVVLHHVSNILTRELTFFRTLDETLNTGISSSLSPQADKTRVSPWRPDTRIEFTFGRLSSDKFAEREDLWIDVEALIIRCNEENHGGTVSTSIWTKHGA
jgi:hypothetical protein